MGQGNGHGPGEAEPRSGYFPETQASVGEAARPDTRV